MNRHRGRNAALSSIFNESEPDLVDPAPSKFRTKFVDKKVMNMQKSRYEKIVKK